MKIDYKCPKIGRFLPFLGNPITIAGKSRSNYPISHWNGPDRTAFSDHPMGYDHHYTLDRGMDGPPATGLYTVHSQIYSNRDLYSMERGYITKGNWGRSPAR